MSDLDLLIFSDLLHAGEAEIGIDKDGEIKWPKDRKRMSEDNNDEVKLDKGSFQTELVDTIFFGQETEFVETIYIIKVKTVGKVGYLWKRIMSGKPLIQPQKTEHEF